MVGLILKFMARAELVPALEVFEAVSKVARCRWVTAQRTTGTARCLSPSLFHDVTIWVDCSGNERLVALRWWRMELSWQNYGPDKLVPLGNTAFKWAAGSTKKSIRWLPQGHENAACAHW